MSFVQTIRPSTASRGTVTMLFTDVEGSTRLLQRLGDQSVHILEDHKALMRRTVEEYGGREVDTAGDGFFIVFDVARDAVAAAVEAQRRLNAHPWPEPVRVRMGLHTGEPIISGNTYLGLDVHRAARICAAGHGGQILISATTRQLVLNELPAGVGLRALGEHRLKDLQNAEQVYQVVGPGLALEFPPLRSSGPQVSNLPLLPGPLIGRETELEAVRGMLRTEHIRLVTLTGPGGTGKTRLALHVAHSLVPEFEDGVLLVQLAATPEAALVPSAVAQALAIQPAADETPLRAALQYLRSRRMLLVLDNFEHVVAAADVVARLLADCPQIRILVTSRVGLHLTAEREYPVPPLSSPDPSREHSPERMLRYPAVELFAQRATAVSPAFRLDADATTAVAEICYRLDGLPLAIELAAARTKIFPPRALLARLGNRLELLSGGARDMPARHQTLRHAIDWSHDLLDAGEQALFRRLAVFVGGASFEALEAVCEAAGPLPFSVLDGVAALVDRSLLRQEAADDSEPRFVTLETIREYALERLLGSGEDTATRTAHADYFIRFAEQAEPHLTGHMQITWLDRLRLEHANLRAVFEYIDRTHDTVRGLRLGAALWRFWVVHGFMTEGRSLLHAVLQMGGADPHVSPLRLKVLAGAATMAHEQGDHEAAAALLDESLVIARASGDRHALGRSLTNLSWVQFHLGDHVRARKLAEEGLAIHRDLQDTRGVALVLNNLGWIDSYEARFDAAVHRHEESLTLRQRLGDARGIAFAQSNLAWVLIDTGTLARGEALLTDAVRTLRGLGDKQLLAYALNLTALLRSKQDRSAEAESALQEALTLSRGIGQLWAMVHELMLLMTIRVYTGGGAPAHELADQCRSATDSVAPWISGQAHRALAEFHRASGSFAQARDYYVRALQKMAEISARGEICACLVGVVVLLSDEGEHTRALTLAGAHDALRSEIGLFEAPAMQRALARAVTKSGAALGDPAAQQALSRGRSMTWRDALELIGASAEGPDKKVSGEAT